MKKSELRKIVREEIELLTEAPTPIISSIGKIADVRNLVDMRKDLEKLFSKRDVDFAFSPVAHFRIKHGGKTIIIVNKKYADRPDLVVKNIAIGYEGKV